MKRLFWLWNLTIFAIIKESVEQTLSTETFCSSPAYTTQCDPRCASNSCNNINSQYDCCYGCQDYGSIKFYRELDVVTSTDISVLWVYSYSDRCVEVCPPGQYEYDLQDNKCFFCDRNCTTCTSSTHLDCKSCADTSYRLNSSACFNEAPKSYGYNPCPDPNYGLEYTMTCEPCPVGCTSCNIYVDELMPGTDYTGTRSMDNTPCAVDASCSYTLRCHSCDSSSGYFLEQGFCYKDECRKYQQYTSSSGGVFSAAFCECLTGYYKSGFTCSRCDFSCLTCSSSGASSCLSCPTGTVLLSGSCLTDSSSIIQEQWTDETPANSLGSWSINETLSSATTSCGGTNWYLGYYGYDLSDITVVFTPIEVAFTVTGGFTSGQHYGVHFRATFLFIDNWDSTNSIVFQEDGAEVHAYNYPMQNVKGEFLCGQNIHDHIAVIDFYFPHNKTTLDLKFFASTPGYAWGFKDVTITQLGCHSSCTHCFGPSQTECLTCSDTNEVVVDGDCTCDIATDYYYPSAGGACTQACGANEYKDNTTRTCVSACAFPLMFHYDGRCYEECPVAAPYRRVSDSFCVAECFDDSGSVLDSANEYKFDGEDKVCYNICPYGTFGDPESKSCVAQCPTTSSQTDYASHGAFSEGNFCVEVCSSSNYAFPQTRECLPACPAGYYSNTKDYGNGKGVEKICEQVCSVTLDGEKLYGDNSTMACVNQCPVETYADSATNLCLGFCNSSAYRQEVGSVRTCVTYCDSANHDIFGDNLTHMCVDATDCPNNTYGDYQSTYCEHACTDASYFGHNESRICVTDCTTGLSPGFAQTDSKLCVETCPSENDDGKGQFGDANGVCVQDCIGSYFADNQTNRECVLTCADTPLETYGLDNECVFNCSATTWADPFHANRICTTACTNDVTTQSYGYNETRKCVEQCPDTEYGQIINVLGTDIPVCLFVCQNDEYGNPLTNLCVDHCPDPYYGDPTGNRTCVLECQTAGYFALNLSAEGTDDRLNRTCVQICPFGWADNFTRMCAMTPEDCTEGLFAHETNHKCVEAIECTGFADPVSRKCVPTCYENATQKVKYYGQRDTHMCVLVCPESPDQFGDNSTDECQLACSEADEVRDPQNDRRCVTENNCSRLPVAYWGDSAKGTCVIALNCTDGTYADNNTMMCQSDCNGGGGLHYADPVSRQCVSLCELGYYALNTSVNVGICSETCPVPEWADNLTVQCTMQCSANTYGVNYTDPNDPTEEIGVCESECPVGQFARDIDNLCVTDCEANHWGETVERVCLTDPKDCPEGYYGDDATNMCVVSTDCSVVGGVQYVADNDTKKCISKCPPLTSTFINYADMAKFLCVAECPDGKFGDNSTLQCLDECKTGGVYNGEYADPQLHICVQICSAAPISTFGENDTYTCVEAQYCPTDEFADEQYYDRVCVDICPDPRVNSTFDHMFADSVSKMCVFECPDLYYGNIINESNYGECVSECPAFANGTLKYADNSSGLCVKVCPVSDGTFGDPDTKRCVKKCPLGRYAQLVHSTFPDRRCVDTCDAGTWSQEVLRTCVTDPFDCPTIDGFHWYAYDTLTKCVEECPSSEDLWGENTTYKCESSCVSGSYKYTVSRVCIDQCPPSLDDDGLFSDQGMCYAECITPNYYRDPQNDRSCQPGCSSSPTKYYADGTTMRCVLRCPTYPTYYFSYDGNFTCMTSCPSTTIKNQATRQCVDSCPTGTFFDENSDSCVQNCPSDYSAGVIWYGDNSLTEPKCVEASDCSNNYFADDYLQLCVQTCSESQWKYGKLCVTHCPDNYYGDASSGFCVLATNCPTDQYGNGESRTCVSVCQGTFADKNNKVCVSVCPTNYYADPATHTCELTCTNNSTISLIKNEANRTCISECPEGLFLNTLNNQCESSCDDPYYEDPTTQICVQNCPSVPALYGQNDTDKCVEECNNTLNEFKYEAARVCVTLCPNGMLKNNHSRFCVDECYDDTFADTEYCVSNCTPKYSLNDPNICTSSCPSPFYKDSTTYKCVLECPTHPQQYYKVVTSTERKCDTACPSGEYRSDLTYECVVTCPPSPPTYADPTSGNCTSVCSNNYYAHKQSRTCVNKCPNGMFADPLSRECVYECQNGTDTYADDTLPTPACVYLCSSGTFANPYNLKCESSCGTSPKTYGFDNTVQRICVESCPYGYIADNSTHECEIHCESTSYPYLDPSTQQCVASCQNPNYQFAFLDTAAGKTTNGSCVTFCPNGYFAHLVNSSCVETCPPGYFGETTNNTCHPNCTIANGIERYADLATNLCTDECPKHNNSYDSFADLYSRQCVTECPSDKNTIKDNNTRKCEPRCTQLDEYADWNSGYCVSACPSNYYADQVTLSCVENCTLYSQRYIYESNRTCVTNCLDVGLYQNEDTRTCVPALECPDGFWGLASTGVCVDECPTSPDMYGDEVTKTCVLSCPNQTTLGSGINYYADISSRECVKECPAVPASFAQNSTKACVSECEDGTFADNYTRKCVAECSIVPGETFADDSTNRCVAVCPTQPNYFASKQSYECVLECSSSPKRYQDYSTRTCVDQCPGGDINTYADEDSRFCVRQCPGSTFMENSTRTCEAICLTGFADPQTKYCIDVCPEYTYGHYGASGENTCVESCPTESPALYAEDANNLCVTSCLPEHGTYRDSSSSRCVKICPISEGFFADNSSNRQCTDQCPQGSYADFSTRYCVSECPSVPALYAIISTRVCTDQCPDHSWADNETRTCVVDKCPSTPDTYADNSTWDCVLQCPTKPMRYADNSSRQCVETCPTTPDYYADNSTRRCVLNCPEETFAEWNSRKCVETCPEGWYGVNNTRRCVQTCPNGEFADHLLNLCVKKCSVDPIYYGNPDTHICVEECPASNFSFGNPLSQECVKYQVNGFSGCPDYLYADNVSRLCTPVCPLKNDTYGDNSTWKCVEQCPAGSQNTFSDNSTMMCVDVCPEYPEYYAEEVSRRCVATCLEPTATFTGSFADNSTRKCVNECPSDPDYFSDNSTLRCVLYCPSNPLTFADYSTRRCVTTCPDDPDIYGDLSTLRCVDQCPQEEQTYADSQTNLCVKICPSTTTPPTFGENDTNRCVDDCPDGSFADNASRLCVQKCPQYPETYGDPDTDRCVSMCPETPIELFADPVSQQCVVTCPNGYFGDNDTNRCEPYCSHDKINYADNSTHLCVQQCPQSEATFGDNSTQTCVKQCPEIPFTYSDNITRHCLSICQNETNGGYAQNETRVCVQKCPDLSYGDITTRYCVTYCPEGWFAYTVTNMCVQTCPEPFYADPTTERCVQMCPVSQLLFGQSIGDRTCTTSCPETTYADFDTQTCVTRCPSKDENLHAYDTFGYNDTNECLEECPIPLYGYPVDYVCVDVCPDPYYENITDHRCYKCPDECETCNYPEACLTCIVDHYLYAGSCVESCPTFPVITYANPNRECGTSAQCTSGYFALNTTKSCVRTCPSGYYKNNDLQTCDACMRGCSTCSNSTSCTVCNTTLSIWFDYKCYTYCSPLRRYYTSTGCVSACPSGTFLSLTTCTACSSICKTCTVQAENCVTCADGLYLSNNLCVEQCPSNFKAADINGSLKCESCSVVDCTVEPLTFEVNQYVEDFQYRIQLRFSQEVNITNQIQNIIAIRQRTSSRLLQTTYSYMNYTIIDYGGGLYEFILNDFDASSGDAQFEVQILDPEAIKSLNGQLADKTRTTVIIDSTSVFSLSDYIKGFTIYCEIVIALAMVGLVLAFWTLPGVYTPMIDLLQLLFAVFLINVNLQPTALLALGSFKASFFTFLPNFFSSSLPTPFYDKEVMNNSAYIILRDFIFLRTMGQLYFIALVVAVLLVTTFLIGKKFFHKKIKKWSKRFCRETFWNKYAFSLLNLLFLPVFMMSFLNFRDYSAGSAVEGFSIFSSWLFMVGFVAAICYFMHQIRKLSKQSPIAYLMLQKAYNFITFQKTVLLINPNHHFIHEKNEVNLTDCSWPAINDLAFLPYPVETRMGPMEITAPMFSLAYKFCVCVFVSLAYDNPVIQVFFFLLANVVYFIYLLLKKPYIRISHRQFNTELLLHNLVVLTLILVTVLIYALNVNTLTMSAKSSIAVAICVIVVYVITVNLVYLVYQLYLYCFEHLWKPFVHTEIFRVNYTVEHLEFVKKYEEQHQKLIKSTRSRAEFLKAIKVQRGEALADMVLRDPNQQSKQRDAFKPVKLRPNRAEEVSKNITTMFESMHKENEQSNKSVRSSDRLSKFERNRVRQKVFERIEPQKEEEFEPVQGNQQFKEQYRREDLDSDHENLEKSDDQSEYSFEYIEEEYPEGTPIEEIMKGCKKGDVIMP